MPPTPLVGCVDGASRHRLQFGESRRRAAGAIRVQPVVCQLPKIALYAGDFRTRPPWLSSLLALAAFTSAAAIAIEACAPAVGGCLDSRCVHSDDGPTPGGGGASSSSSGTTGGGMAGAGGGGSAPCPGETPGCVNEWIAADVLSEIGGIAGYKDSLYVAANKAIYRIPFGTTVPKPIAGSPNAAGWKDGLGNNARFRTIAGIAVDEQRGLLFVVDAGNCAIRSVDLTSSPNETRAVVPNTGGEPTCFSAAYADGPATGATLRSPVGIALDASNPHGFAYFTDVSAVRSVDLSNLSNVTVKTLAGDQSPNALFAQPRGLAALASTIVVADQGKRSIQSLDLLNGNVVSTACGGASDGTIDGGCGTATFGMPFSFAVNSAPSSQLLYVADGEHDNVRAIELSGSSKPSKVSTLAGGAAGHAVGIGATAGIVAPSWMYVRAGTPSELYIVENGDQIRRMVLP